jgi:hypothetical protein
LKVWATGVALPSLMVNAAKAGICVHLDRG